MDKDDELNPKEKFYYDNFPDLPKKFKKSNKHNVQIFTYNVHGWENFDKNTTIYDTYKLIKKMILKYDFDILVFQELASYHKLTLNYIIDDYYDEGYKYYAHCTNGDSRFMKDQNTRILILSKNELKEVKSINLTIGEFTRNSLFVKTKKINLVAVHLEIGKRYHHLKGDDPNRNKIDFNNRLMRKWQLNRIFNNFDKIDIIVGDFNFEQGDPEFQFMIEDKKFIWDRLNSNTTPFNRVDYMFLNQESQLNFVNKGCHIIKCNYSDHLPVICEFSKK